jgi:hypothetical protein
VADEILSELLQFGSIELAVAVGVKGHGMRDDAVDGRRAPLPSAPAASARSATTGTAATRTARTSGTIGSAITRPGASGPSSVVSRPIVRTLGSAGSAFGLRAASESLSVAPASRSALRMQFVFAQLPVAVLVESFECGRCVGDLFRRKLAVVIGVEHLHQRIARRAKSAAAPAPFRATFGRATPLALVVALRRAFRRLCENSGRPEGTKQAGDPKRATHDCLLGIASSGGDRHFPPATQ